MRALTLLSLLLLAGCGDDSSPRPDAAMLDAAAPDTGTVDAGGVDAPAAPDTGPAPDSGGMVPEVFSVLFHTSVGDFVVEAHRSWSPNGVDRFHELVTSGFYDECRFFRVIPGFVVQFGINGDPTVSSMWRTRTIPDDPVVESNVRGYVTFAKTSSPDSRTTQLFVNYADNSALDAMGFSPIGQITSGMDVVDMINAEYGEMPSQSRIQTEGNAYLDATFPNLDYVITATIM